jgi:methionyl-tRNA synthetase
MKKSFYITTTLPYVNAEPHIGFAYEILVADVLARSKTDREVFFNTGTDEHGQKIFEAAEKAGVGVKEYVDQYAEEFKKLKDTLGLSENLHFIRTTNDGHVRAAQAMWKKCFDKGDIELREYEGLYCVGCEKFLTNKEIVEGKCHIHGTDPQALKEKNYFFKFSKYQKDLLDYLNNDGVIVPEYRRQEAINFVQEGLEDFSISREKARLSWGIPVPGDDTQVMYVWFDALTSYISTLGWPDESGDFKKFWADADTLQIAGKDQVRFQSLMFQAMLMSADIKNTEQIFYHGFINSGGQKMSKSLGNVISPKELVEKYGTEATRYLLLRHVHPTEDTDVTWERLDEWYNAGLANGLGNLVSRITNMVEKYKITQVIINPKATGPEGFELSKYMDDIWLEIQNLDKKIQDQEPYKVFKIDQDKAKTIVIELFTELSHIAKRLTPVMPVTSKIIFDSLANLSKPDNLFPRLN